jgi:predicted metal-binding membrane protein
VFTIERMRGMDMGVATRLGSFPYFLSVWVPMMAAMMLPGAAPAALRLEPAGRRVLDVPRYVVAYLGVWALAGVIVFALYRPHATVTAGVFTVAAGIYELTPIKRRFRQMCQETVLSGLGLGLCCVGSTVGLMLMMVVLGVMSVAWMAVVAGVVLAQKLLPPRVALDVPITLAILGLGIAILVAPSSVPGLVPAMRSMPSM